MLSHQENQRLTRTGNAEPAGRLLRLFWQPVALVDELDSGRPLKLVRVLGEERVLVRDESSRYALIQRHCPHRGADLCYGRLEDGGLRCPFHGWLFNLDGRCLEQPAEPPGSSFHEKIRLPVYPCREVNGIVFAYMGDQDPPPLPNLDCFSAPREHSFAFKGYMSCNWLQALEVGIDPAHASFLHRFLGDADPSTSYGQQFRDQVGDSDLPLTRILREFPRPEIRIEKTDFGMRLVTLRNLNGESMHVRITNQVFPQAIVIPMSREMTITQWHVPVDDKSCYWYAMFTSFGDPVDHALMRRQRLESYALPDYKPVMNGANNYGYDPQQQRTQTYTGMGFDINVHDHWAVESMGAVQDRSREHLGRTDIGIRINRQRLAAAIEAVESGRQTEVCGYGFETPPVAVDALTEVQGWQQQWMDAERRRRQQCRWLNDPEQAP